MKVRAVGITAAGGPEALAVIRREVRDPGPSEVWIAVRAAAVNPTDIGLREREGSTPPPWIPGMDATGTIEALGPGVEDLELGQPVMAAASPRRPDGGAQTEMLVVPAASVAPIPDGATFEQAATLPMNGLTALAGLELLHLPTGAQLAVTGAAGLLGSYVVAIAKLRGLRVIADAQPSDEQLVRSLGADVVVPRGTALVGAVRDAAPAGVDGVFDTAMLHAAAFGVLRDAGTMVVVRGWTPTDTEREIVVKQVAVAQVLERTDWLRELARYASDGRTALRVAGTYSPENAAEAHRRMEAGSLRGRAVIVFEPGFGGETVTARTRVLETTK